MTANPKAIRSKTGVRQAHKASRTKYADRPEIAFFLQDWDDGYNVGGLLRLADGLGVKAVFATGKTPLPETSPMVGVTSMGAHRRIEIAHMPGHEDMARHLCDQGWTLVAVEIAEGSVDITDFTFPPNTCLVLGAEGGGVYSGVLKHCHAVVQIPMFGKGRSLNVVVAAAVAAYWAALQPAR